MKINRLKLVCFSIILLLGFTFIKAQTLDKDLLHGCWESIKKELKNGESGENPHAGADLQSVPCNKSYK